LDEVAYQSYSPLFLSTTFAFSYALSFGSLSSVLVHTALFHWNEIVDKFRATSQSKHNDDVHMRLYRKYPEVPDWWYLVIFTIMMILSIIVCEAWDTRLPWWGFLITQLLPFIFTLPIGMVQAITNVQIGLNVITEFVAGYMFPGRPLANMMIKCYGYMTMAQVFYCGMELIQGLQFVADLKLGLYMKIPPRSLFRTQIWCTILAYVLCLIDAGQL
jgi:OPT family oligopeptide transporter